MKKLIKTKKLFICTKQTHTQVSEGFKNTAWWSQWLNSFFPTVKTSWLSSFVYCNFVCSLFLLFCTRVVVRPSVNFCRTIIKTPVLRDTTPHICLLFLFQIIFHWVFQVIFTTSQLTIPKGIHIHTKCIFCDWWAN